MCDVTALPNSLLPHNQIMFVTNGTLSMTSLIVARRMKDSLRLGIHLLYISLLKVLLNFYQESCCTSICSQSYSQ